MLILAGFPVAGATLESLSLDQLIEKSTAIVRGRVTASHAVKRGQVIYTVSNVDVMEQWKGAPGGSAEAALPGGVLDGQRQTFSGAPTLDLGREYVLFLWTGEGGLTQVIGMSQGVFGVLKDASGVMIARQTPSQGVVIPAAGGAPAAAITLPLDELRNRVQQFSKAAKR